MLFNLSYLLAHPALLAVGVIRQLGEIALPASLWQIRVLRGEHLAGLARVEAEHGGLVFAVLANLGGGALTSLAGLVAVGKRVFVVQHLHGGASAVPAVGRVVLVPELVRWWECYPLKSGVLGTHEAVHGGSVLEVVFVAVTLDVGPFCRHLGAGRGKVVFCIKVVLVVLCVDGLHALEETVERLEAAVIVLQQSRGVVKLVVGLEAGEEEDVLVEGTGHLVGDAAFQTTQLLGQNVVGGADQREGFGLGEHLGFEGLLPVEPFGGVVKRL